MVYGTTTIFHPEFEGRIASEIETAELPESWRKFLGRNASEAAKLASTCRSFPGDGIRLSSDTAARPALEDEIQAGPDLTPAQSLTSKFESRNSKQARSTKH